MIWVFRVDACETECLPEMHINIYFPFPRYIIAVVIVCRLCFLVHHGFYDCPKLRNKSARRRKTLLLRPLLRRTFENYIPKIY